MTPTEIAEIESVRTVAEGLRMPRSLGQGHVGARDGRCAGTAVGTQDVAVQDDGVLAEGTNIDDAAQGTTDEARDLLGAPAHLAFNGLAGRTLFGGAREHRVLAGHPAFARVAFPARHSFGEGCHAQDAGVAELDEDVSFAGARPPAGDGDRTELGRGAPIGAQGVSSHSA